MAKKYSSNSSGNMLTVIMVAAVVAVLALGVWAVWGTISTNVRNNQLANGAEPTVAEMADQSGMEVEDFLAQYGVADNGLNGKSLMSEMTEPMTLSNYATFMGVDLTDEDFAAFKLANELGDDVTKDTTDADVKSKYYMYAYQKKMAEQAADEAENEPATGAETVEIPAAE